MIKDIMMSVLVFLIHGGFTCMYVSRVYLNGGRRRKSPPVTVFLPAVIQCFQMYMY